MKCFVCDKEIERVKHNSRYCSSECRNMRIKLIKAREVCRLSDEEKALRIKLIEKTIGEGGFDG